MEFVTRDAEPSFQPVELVITVSTYEELHRIANGLGTSGSDVVKGVKALARKVLLDRQTEEYKDSVEKKRVEEPAVVKKSALRGSKTTNS